MTAELLKTLTRARLREARHLLNSRNYNGAYYLSGYAAELALKACIAKKINKREIPDKKFINDCYTHNVHDLVKLAGLESDRHAKSSDANFAANWAIVKDWNERSRYKTYTRTQARELYLALTSRTQGILPWIRRHW